MGVPVRLPAVTYAGLLLILVWACAPQGSGAEPPDPKKKTDAPAAPAKTPPAPGAPAPSEAAALSAEDLAQVEKIAKLLPDPAPAAGLETSDRKSVV